MTQPLNSPDIGSLTPELLNPASCLRIMIFLRDNFTCQLMSGGYTETATLELFAVGFPKHATIFNTVTSCQRCCKLIAGQQSPAIVDDLALIESTTYAWLQKYPNVQTVLDRYVELIKDNHRLARITYFRVLNQVKQTTGT